MVSGACCDRGPTINTLVLFLSREKEKYPLVRTDHDLSAVDDLVLHPPLRELVRNMRSTDPTEEARAIDIAGADYTGLVSPGNMS